MHGEGRAPSQDEIQQKLLTLEHVKELIQDFKRNGGLMDPVIVRTGTSEVIEGNSRLAAYRALAKIDPIKWGLIKATFLPLDIDDSLIFRDYPEFDTHGRYAYRRLRFIQRVAWGGSGSPLVCWSAGSSL